MESDLGKLFIGGISWDTDENRLKEYFGQYGEVVEAVIMRDRFTGRARGFGFIVFADPAIAEEVVMDKHMIDGRTVEAKKAVPRDDHRILSRNNSSIQGSPGPGRTKKIFVGGLASTVTERDFKNYFDQFGIITDVVVMYDHNTQRPRGFGFITFDSEDAVDRVLHKTFHELNGKLVEVKRAVPKELSPGPSRSPLLGYGLNRGSNFINSYGQGYNLSFLGGYGRFNPVSSGRSGFPAFGTAGYQVGINMGPRLSASYAGNSSFTSTPGYGRLLGPYYSGNLNRYNTPIGYNGGNLRSESPFSSTNQNVWGSGSFNNPTNPPSPGAFLGSRSGNFGVSFGDSGGNWGSSTVTSRVGGAASGYRSGNLGYGLGESNYGLGGGVYSISTGSTAAAPTSSLSGATGGLDTSYGDLYSGGTAYGDSTWRTSSEPEGSASFGFWLGNAASDVASRTSDGYIGNYSVTNSQPNRGIAA